MRAARVCRFCGRDLPDQWATIPENHYGTTADHVTLGEPKGLSRRPWLAALFSKKIYHVDSGGSIPTILIGDFVLSEQNYYRFNVPIRGDMAAFEFPSNKTSTYIKRIIGLPGDKIRLQHGNIYINEHLVPCWQIEDYVYHKDCAMISMHQYIEALPRRPNEPPLQHPIIKIAVDGRLLDDTAVYDVPQGYYFVMGDNRDNSQDSRAMSAFGYIPARNIVGRVVTVIWPFRRMGTKIN
jgi:signal peptidase I